MDRIKRREDGTLVVDTGGITHTVIPGRPDGLEQFSRSGISDDAYPNIIGDQRTIYRVAAQDAADMEQHWEQFLSGQNPPKGIIDSGETVIPYINHSRWVVDCLHCLSSAGAWDRNPYACCLSCGHKYSVQWQPPKERAEIIRVLAARPAEHRNWTPQTGETVEDLIRQNILMLGVDVKTVYGLMMAANVTPPEAIVDQATVAETIVQQKTGEL